MTEKDAKIIEILQSISEAIMNPEFRSMHVITINVQINELYELMNKE